MRSVFDLLLFIGCVFFPKAALGVVVPVYVYRAPPTLSPTSPPSSQPSSRPSSQPTNNPSLTPSYQPSSDPTSNPSISRNPSLSPSTNPSSVSSSFMMNPDAMSKPSSLGLGLKLSISLICVLLFFVGAWFHFEQKQRKQCLPCFVPRGDKTSQDEMQDKVQEKQSVENQNDALPPAEGDNDGWTVVLSPLMAVGRFLSSMISPAPPQEEQLSPEEEPSNPPSPVVKKGRFLSSLVSSARPREELSSEEPSNPPSPVGKKKSSSLLNLKRSNAQAVSRGSFSISTKKSKKWQHVAC